MNRRAFLHGLTKAVIAGCAAAALPTGFDAQAASGKLYRGTADGKLFESVDGGESWQLNADFGDECPVLGIRQHGEEAFVQLGFRDFSFFIKSPNGTFWRSSAGQSLATVYLPFLTAR